MIIPSKRDTLTQCWHIAGQPSDILAQHSDDLMQRRVFTGSLFFKINMVLVTLFRACPFNGVVL